MTDDHALRVALAVRVLDASNDFQALRLGDQLWEACWCDAGVYASTMIAAGKVRRDRDLGSRRTEPTPGVSPPPERRAIPCGAHPTAGRVTALPHGAPPLTPPAGIALARGWLDRLWLQRAEAAAAWVLAGVLVWLVAK